MKWILVDVVLALLALGVLAVLLLGLWRKVKALSSTVTRASEAVGRASEALTLDQGDGPLGQVPARSAPPVIPSRPSAVHRASTR